MKTMLRATNKPNIHRAIVVIIVIIDPKSFGPAGSAGNEEEVVGSNTVGVGEVFAPTMDTGINPDSKRVAWTTNFLIDKLIITDLLHYYTKQEFLFLDYGVGGTVKILWINTPNVPENRLITKATTA